MEFQKMSHGQIETKLDKNWTNIGKKTLFCLNACLTSKLHFKSEFWSKNVPILSYSRKSYQLDIFKGFQLVTVGPLCISYCHMKTAPPMNTFDFNCIKSVHR